MVYFVICAAVVGIFALIFMVLAPIADQTLPMLAIGFLALLGVILVIVLIAMLMTSFQLRSAVCVVIQIIGLLLCIGGSILTAKITYDTIGTTFEKKDYSDGHMCDICYITPADGGRAINRTSVFGDDDKIFYYCETHFDQMKKKVTGERSPTSETESYFTNAYGTPDTVCAASGCSKTIAISGDTAYCRSHSSRCLNCNCYCDADAMYCMVCIEDALGG